MDFTSRARLALFYLISQEGTTHSEHRRRTENMSEKTTETARDDKATTSATPAVKSIAEMEASIRGELPAMLVNTIMLATGATTTKTTYRAAGLVTVEKSETDAQGKVRRWKEPAYPDKDPEEMVPATTTSKVHKPNRQAIAYLKRFVKKVPDWEAIARSGGATDDLLVKVSAQLTPPAPSETEG